MQRIVDADKATLEHWGIKGMKWGFRRFQNKDGSLTAAGRKRYGKLLVANPAVNRVVRLSLPALRKRSKIL